MADALLAAFPNIANAVRKEKTMHTPLPWRMHDTETETIVGIWPGQPDGKIGGGFALASTSAMMRPREVNEANAALIVQAVNERAGLIAERDALLAVMTKIAQGLSQTNIAKQVDNGSIRQLARLAGEMADEAQMASARAALAKGAA